MRKAVLGGKAVEIYDSIEELPIRRFHVYNKMLLVDAGIGSDLADFDRHIEKTMRLIQGKNPQMALVELRNMRTNVYFVQQNLSPKYLAFAALVKSIDGRPCEDISEDGLRGVLEKLGGATTGEMTAESEAVKKKIDEELRTYFPRLFDDASVKEYYDKLRGRTLAVLRTVISGEATEDDRKEIERLTNALITYFNPRSFEGSDGAEVQYDRQFENMCLVISQNLHTDPKKMNVLEYYNAFDYVQEQARKAKHRKRAK